MSNEDRLESSRTRRTARLAGATAAVAARGGAARALSMGSEGPGESGRTARQRAAARQQIKAAEGLVRVLAHMRGAAMKLGQALSALDLALVPDDLRAEVRDALALLQNDAEPVSFSAVERILNEELGGPLTDTFAEFDPDPVAAASIGQVHQATLRRDGRRVAVKVQYPGVAEAIHGDLMNLRVALRMIALVAPELNTTELAGELKERITDELDYGLEAANQTRMANLYKGHPFIVVPEVIGSLSGERVLVSEFVDGERFGAAVCWPQAARDRLGEILARFYLHGPMRHQLLNGDPHPGNLILLTDGRVAFVDYGFFRQLSDEETRQARATAKALRDEDADALLQVLSELGALSHEDGAAGPVLEVCQTFIGWMLRDEPVTVDSERTAEMLSGYMMLRDSRELSGLQIPARHLALLRAIATLVGVLGQLRACNNWRRLADEWVLGTDPSTALGRDESAFLASQADSSIT